MDEKKVSFFDALKRGDIKKIKQHIKEFSNKNEGLNFTFHEPSKWSHTPLIILTRPAFTLGDDGPFLPNIKREDQLELVSMCLENGANPQFGKFFISTFSYLCF